MLFKNYRLYIILSFACIVGYVWLLLNLLHIRAVQGTHACLFKTITNIPCPSCGATRSIILLFHGEFLKALMLNPIGIIVAGIMLIAPFWICFDILTKQKTLMNFYLQLEIYLKNAFIAIPLVVLILLNWGWNIIKEL